MAAPPEERHVRRYEAFSDIVIGFSLAQLGVSLAIPAKASELFANPWWLVAFFWAFAMICAMWWFHHRFFAALFVPVTSLVLINFLWLAIVVLCVFSTQITVRFPTETGVWRMYYVLFGLAYALLALSYRIAIRLRAGDLDAAGRFAAERSYTFMLLWTLPFAVCTVALCVFPWGALSGMTIWAAFTATGIASAVLGRRFRHREAALAREPAATLSG